MIYRWAAARPFQGEETRNVRGLRDRETERWEEENRTCPQWEQTQSQPKRSPVCQWEKTLSEWGNKTSRHINFWPQFDCKLPPQPGARHSRGGEQHRFKWHLGRKTKKLCAGSHWIISPASYGKFSVQTTARFNVQVSWLWVIVPITEQVTPAGSAMRCFGKMRWMEAAGAGEQALNRSKTRAHLSLSCTVLQKLEREEEKMGNDLNLYQFIFNRRKNFFTVRVVKHWHPLGWWVLHPWKH